MWYYAVDGEKCGPIDEDELRRLINEGDLGLNGLVWSSGMEEWRPVSEIDELHPSPPPLTQEEANSFSSPPVSEETFSNLEDNDTLPVGSIYTSNTNKSSEKEGTPAVTYAGFGIRLVAHIIDVMIVAFASSFVGLIAFSADSTVDIQELSRSTGFWLMWLYFSAFESSKRQATPGKQLMGLKVTDLKRNRIGFWKATGRHFGKIISGAILLIGFIMAAFTEKKQALHDKMAGCLVVEE